MPAQAVRSRIERDQRLREKRNASARLRHGFTPFWGEGERPSGPNGERLCIVCGGLVVKPRRDYCGAACIETRMILSSSSYARGKVLERDGGICVECHIDTGRLQAAYDRAKKLDDVHGFYQCSVCEARYERGVSVFRCEECRSTHSCRWTAPYRARQRVVRVAIAHRFKRATFDKGLPLWEMDHVVPVTEGGGRCGLENLRTLCRPCHVDATAALAKRLAHARRAERKRNQRMLFQDHES